jgi:cAMP-dependent protein kinase regulator
MLPVSDAKKVWIVEQLNPILEEVVAETISKTPEDPVRFMLELMEKRKATKEDSTLSSEDMLRLQKENEQLAKAVSGVREEAAARGVKLATVDISESKVEEDPESSDGEPPDGFFDDKPKSTQARQSVSAEAYGEWNTVKTFVPPTIAKTDEQKTRLKEVLSKSFLFSGLGEEDFTVVIGAMKEVIAKTGDRLIAKGDSGDFLFVVETGALNCIIAGPDGKDKIVKTCVSGDVFGELALLYNCPRAANVDASEACVLWQLDRDTFNAIVKAAAQKKRNRYESFLAGVPLLSNMDAYERALLCDALKLKVFNDGAAIVTQGEPGTFFYLLEAGNAVAMKDGQEVMKYTEGSYFGELALLKSQPRAASVIAQGVVKALYIDSGSFNRLLNIQDLLQRTTSYS